MPDNETGLFGQHPDGYDWRGEGKGFIVFAPSRRPDIPAKTKQVEGQRVVVKPAKEGGVYEIIHADTPLPLTEEIRAEFPLTTRTGSSGVEGQSIPPELAGESAGVAEAMAAAAQTASVWRLGYHPGLLS